MTTNAAANVDTKKFGRNPISFIWGGVNDGVDGQTMYDRLQTYCLARRAAGWKTIVCTEIDAQGANQISNGYHATHYLALNILLRADHSFADGFADLGADPRLQDATDVTYYLSDLVHLTDAGYAVVASIVAPVIAAL